MGLLQSSQDCRAACVSADLFLSHAQSLWTGQAHGSPKQTQPVLPTLLLKKHQYPCCVADMILQSKYVSMRTWQRPNQINPAAGTTGMTRLRPDDFAENQTALFVMPVIPAHVTPVENAM